MRVPANSNAVGSVTAPGEAALLHSLNSLRITLEPNMVLHPVHHEGNGSVINSVHRRHVHLMVKGGPINSRLAAARRLRPRKFKTPRELISPATYRARPSFQNRFDKVVPVDQALWQFIRWARTLSSPCSLCLLKNTRQQHPSFSAPWP